MTPPNTTTLTLHIDGMHCGSCALLIDDTLHDLPGVINSHTTTKRARATIELDTSTTSPQDLINAITELGYHARPHTEQA